MKTLYKANFSFTFTGHAGFVLPCPAVLPCLVLLFYRTGHFLKILPCPAPGQGGKQGRAGCPVLWTPLGQTIY